MFKAAILVQKQAALQMHADTTNISALLLLNTWSERLLAVLQVQVLVLRRFRPMLFVSLLPFILHQE